MTTVDLYFHSYGFQPEEWAKENCPGYVTYDLLTLEYLSPYVSRYYFQTEQDAMLFKMRWG